MGGTTELKEVRIGAGTVINLGYEWLANFIVVPETNTIDGIDNLFEMTFEHLTRDSATEVKYLDQVLEKRQDVPAKVVTIVSKENE